MSAILAENRYGKSRVRMVRVSKHAGRHNLKDVSVDIQLEGDFAAAHLTGDNSKILPTDTMKNTVYALATECEDEEIEDFALRLAGHFLRHNAQINRARIDIAENSWARLSAHAFLRSSGEKRTAGVTATREQTNIVSGLTDLIVLKTTDSAFEGYIKDRFTTLPETKDRILGTAIRAEWTYTRPDPGFGDCWRGIRQKMLDVFAAMHSPSVQHTAFHMGKAVLEAFPEVAGISLSLPNKHCLLVDLEPFSLPNNNEIFVPIDEPYGLIEVMVKRD